MAEQSQIPASEYIRPFYPALDGLRAVAFLLVFLVHYGLAAGWKLFQWGWVGVDVFFVLSGFLITGILVDSLESPSYFRNFYIRRSLRIFPLFYLFWIAVLVVTPLLHVQWNRYVLLQALYLGNWSYFFLHASSQAGPGVIFYSSVRHLGQTGSVVTGHFWSLCVEEQFYLLWPAVVWLVRSRKMLLRVSLLVVAVVPILRIIFMHYVPGAREEGVLYDVTIFRIDSLMVGAAVALWLRDAKATTATVRKVAAGTLLGAPAIYALLYCKEKVHATNPGHDYVSTTVGYTMIAITAAAILLLSIDPTTYIYRILQARPLTYLGRLSYGMYFIHGLALNAVMNNSSVLIHRHLGFLNILLPFAGTVLAAHLSFRFLESPFLRLKNVLAPTRHRVADPPPSEVSEILPVYETLRHAA